MRKSIAIALVLLGIVAANAFAVGEARLTGKVVDPTGKGIPDVTITVKAIEQKTFEEDFKTDAKGNFAIFLLTGTIKYEFTFKKEGYAPYAEIMKLKLVPEKNDKTITLGKGASGVVGGEVKIDPAITTFNEGVALINGGDEPGGIKKIEEALALNPQLVAGYQALAKISAREKEWAKAIDYATKALSFDDEDSAMMSILADAYEKTGDKAKAAEFRKKAPANPTWLFNEAARLINAGKDKEAEPLLSQAVDADPDFATAHYELGMLYVRLGDSPHAKEHLNKYIELEPTGKDAPTAKEMLKYVQ